MHRSVRQVAEVRNLVVDLHAEDGHLLKQALVGQFARTHVRVELGDEAGRAVVLDDFDDALLYVFIFDDLGFEGLGVDPFDSGWLHSVFAIRIMHQLIIKEFLNKFIQFLSRT